MKKQKASSESRGPGSSPRL
uniref:Uncharacterized protein n=1 Tax=Anguilla anguilla TaxID=7936 RepID=A0A0E9TTV6_ANGAN